MISALLAKVEAGEATAADLNVARQLLKDNNISTDASSLDEQELALQRAMAELDMELPQ